MRIAFVTSWLSRKGGGVATVVEALSGALADRGVEIAVFGLEDAEWLREDRSAWRGAEPHVSAIRGPKMTGYAPDLPTSLIRWAPDIVHSHGLWTYSSRTVVSWSRKSSRPYVVSPHGMLDDWAIANAAWKKKIAGLLYESAHLNGAEVLHALGAPEARSIEKLGLRPPIAIVPNGIALPVSSVANAPPPWPSVQAGVRTLLFLGRVHPKKNLAAFLRAWAVSRPQAEANGEPWHLVVAGWDQAGHGDELRALCQMLGIAETVTFAGALFGAQKEAAFMNSDAFILPSLSEGLPMTVLEAWSFGLPVLMTSACNLEDGFEVGAAHRLEFSEEAMVRDLSVFLCLDRPAHHRMGNFGRQLVSTRYSWGRIADAFCEIYRSCRTQSRIY